MGVDFGTSNTVAVLARDGRVRHLLFDGSPLLPSAACADSGGGLVVGRDAVHLGRSTPERFEPNPKRRLGDATVLLGEVEFPVVDVVAAVLARVRAEAVAVTGRDADGVTLTCPAARRRRRTDLRPRSRHLVSPSAPTEPSSPRTGWRSTPPPGAPSP